MVNVVYALIMTYNRLARRSQRGSAAAKQRTIIYLESFLRIKSPLDLMYQINIV